MDVKRDFVENSNFIRFISFIGYRTPFLSTKSLRTNDQDDILICYHMIPQGKRWNGFHSSELCNDAFARTERDLPRFAEHLATLYKPATYLKRSAGRGALEYNPQLKSMRDDFIDMTGQDHIPATG